MLTHKFVHLFGILNFVVGTLMHFLNLFPRILILAQTFGTLILYSRLKTEVTGAQFVADFVV